MKKGFTLIELIVIVGVIAVIMIAVTGVLLSSFKAKNRVDYSDRIEQTGSWALSEIRKNILNAKGSTVGCGDSQVSFTNIKDIEAETTTIVCDSVGSKIASSSANSADLTPDDVRVTGCGTFISCDTLPSSEVSRVNFSFSIEAGNPAAGPEGYVSREFKTSVTVRN